MKKINILFVCLGNICRSPMAEFIMKYLVSEDGISNNYFISSAATSDEEQGNGMHYGTRRVLTDKGIPFTEHYARKLSKDDYDKYDYIIGMDQNNIRDMLLFFGGDPKNKISLLLSFAGENRSVADPWYTGNFEKTYNDIFLGCKELRKII